MECGFCFLFFVSCSRHFHFIRHFCSTNAESIHPVPSSQQGGRKTWTEDS